MITKSYYLIDSAACAAAVAALERSIICTTWIELLCGSYVKYTIRCRLQDVPAVEAALAAFV